MNFSWLGRLLPNRSRSPKRARSDRSRPHYRRLELETLEARIAPATRIWTGGAGDGMWTTPTNWNGAVAPAAGDDLIFPAGALFLTTTNNFASGTAFRSITFTGFNYVINGNPLFISNGITSAQSANNTTNTINVALLFTGSQTFQTVLPGTNLTLNGALDLGTHTLTLDGAGRINLQGVISGSAATAIVKNGIGTTFINQNNTYTGTVFINNGILVGQNQALGSPTSGTIVADGASLGTNGTLTLEPVTVTGSGFGGEGAFGVFPGFAGGTFSGNLTMFGDTVINVIGGQTLAITGTVSGTANLVMQGLGTLNFANAMPYSGTTTINGGQLQLSGNLGAVTSTPSIAVNLGGALFIDNVTGTTNPPPNRIPDTASIILNDGSRLRYERTNAAGLNQDETVGDIIIGRGVNTIQIVPSVTTSGTSILTANSLTRTGPGAYLNVVSNAGVNLGTMGALTNLFLLNNAPDLFGPSSSTKIVPWITVTNSGNGNMFHATYDGPNGLRVLGAVYTAVTNTAGLSAADDDVNLRINPGAATTLALDRDRTFNSLLIQAPNAAGGNVILDLAGFTLTIRSREEVSPGVFVNGPGTIVTNSGGNNTAVTIQNGTLRFEHDDVDDELDEIVEGIITFNTVAGGTGITNLNNVVIDRALFLTLQSPLNNGGVLRFTGGDANTYNGSTLVNNGRLELQKGAGVDAIPGGTNLFIGSNGANFSGSNGNSATVRLNTNDNQIAATVNVIISNTGQLDLSTGNRSDTVNNVTVTSGYFQPAASLGHISTGTGTLSFLGDFNVTRADIHLPVNQRVNSFSQFAPALVTGILNLGSTSKNFDVIDGPAVYDVELRSSVLGSGTAGINKRLGGAMILSNANINAYNFPGVITVNGGILDLGSVIPNTLTVMNIANNVNLLNGALQGGLNTIFTSVLDVTPAFGTVLRPGQVAGPDGLTRTPFGFPTTTRGILRIGAANLSNATVEIEVANVITAGTDYDQLQATGSVTLGGVSTLVVDLKGLNEITSAQIPIITTAGLGGTRFANFQVLNNPNNYFVFPSYSDTTVFLNIVRTNVPSTLNDVFAVAPGVGTAGPVRVYDAVTRQQLWSFTPFPGFTGEIHVAVADVNNDMIQDVIVAAGAGGGPHVRVFDGKTGQQMAGAIGNFFAYGAGFTGGVYVAAGDVNGDGFADVITGPGAGGGPHVKVFSGATGAVLSSFFAYNSGFTGGVRVAAGDVTGDTLANVITAPGPGGGPHIRVFNGLTGAQVPGAIGSFFAYSSSFTGGVFVAAADLNGDGRADIITGPDAGGGPHVKAFNATNPSTLLASFFAYSPGFTGGVRVAAARANTTGFAEIITGTGSGGSPLVRIFDPDLIPAALIDQFFAYDPLFAGGIFVGGGRSRVI
ncbi:MAG: beta strand repeat-containing protein [Gemmataceae bacterium]